MMDVLDQFFVLHWFKNIIYRHAITSCLNNFSSFLVCNLLIKEDILIQWHFEREW